MRLDPRCSRPCRLPHSLRQWPNIGRRQARTTRKSLTPMPCPDCCVRARSTMLYPRTTPQSPTLSPLTHTSALTSNLGLSTRASRAHHYRVGLATEPFFDRPVSVLLRHSARVLGCLARYASCIALSILARSLDVAIFFGPVIFCLLLWSHPFPFLPHLNLFCSQHR